ncbi:MAG: hypothetical protein FJ013_08585 [Chloroflexi bacterium]|nr:hypothetical protein [Chloroflexota bacterium]
MVNRFGGIPYFVGLRVEGIKPVLDDALKRGESNIIKIIRDYFSPEVEKTNRFMDYDQSINTIRSAWMMLAHFDLFYGENRHIDTVIVSGVGYTPQNHELLLNKFKNVIHSYGYFAFGDALGIPFSGNLDYYPAFPYTIFTVIDDKGKVVDYGKEGHPVFIVARKDLLLVLKEENEFAIRISPTDSFNWDGIRNPRRVI